MSGPLRALCSVISKVVEFKPIPLVQDFFLSMRDLSDEVSEISECGLR